MDIPDINVWLALTDHNHVHHAPAAHYWEEVAAPKIAFTRITMLGLLRLSTQPRVLSRTLTPPEAWVVYHDFTALSHIQFLAEPAALESHFQTVTASEFPHRMWTDAYLAAFAIASDCRLISFDADFSRFPGLHFLHLKP